MTKYLHMYMMIVLLITSCAIPTSNDVPPVEITAETTPSPTMPVAQVVSPTNIPYGVALPAVTLSPLENENALLALLRTNGNCKGKCLGGIYPDAMTVQDAINVISQWGMIEIGKNSQGKTFINLVQSQLYDQLSIYLSIGTWTREFETIDKVAIRIDATLTSADSHYVGEDVWLANREAFRGFSMDGILEAYGTPSYVGYDFISLLDPSIMPLKAGERFEYGMSIHFEEINLGILLAGRAYYDGEQVFLCPSKEPHYLYLQINPERPLKDLEATYPVTWQNLSGTDLNTFYQTFTGENAFDVCVTTTMDQLLTLQP